MRGVLREEWQWLIRRRRIGILLAGTVLVMLLVAQGTGQVASVASLDSALIASIPLLNAQIGRLFATSLCLALQGWLMLLAPLVAVSVVAPQSAILDPARLIARLLALWGVMLLALVLTLPFFSLLPLFGSLSLPEVGWAFAVIVATMLLSGAYSLCWTTVVRNPPAALFLSYSVLLIWLVAVVLIATTNPTPSVLAVLAIAFNPFAALLSPLAPAFPPDGPIATDLQNLLRFTHGAIARETPLYRLYVAGSGLLILASVAIASFAVRPLPRRWQRFDTLLLSVLLIYLAGLLFWREWWSAALP